MISPDHVREDLARTGVLFTQHADDPGHISLFWRCRIEGLCYALESAPLDSAVRLRQEQAEHEITKAELTRSTKKVQHLQARIESILADNTAAEASRQAAFVLIEEAVPRMRTLNNAMSPGWLDRASSLLGV